MTATGCPPAPVFDFSPPSGTDEFYAGIQERASAAVAEQAGARAAAAVAKSARETARAVKKRVEEERPILPSLK